MPRCRHGRAPALSRLLPLSLLLAPALLLAEPAAASTALPPEPPRPDLRGLAVGIGRPRLIHVPYPYEGHEVHCTGSVMSYYEYWDRARLTDEEWKVELDSSTPPPMPDWLTPFVAK